MRIGAQTLMTRALYELGALGGHKSMTRSICCGKWARWRSYRGLSRCQCENDGRVESTSRPLLYTSPCRTGTGSKPVSILIKLAHIKLEE